MLVALTLLVINGCGGIGDNAVGVKLSEREAYRYEKVLQVFMKVEAEYKCVASVQSQEAYKSKETDV